MPAAAPHVKIFTPYIPKFVSRADSPIFFLVARFFALHWGLATTLPIEGMPRPTTRLALLLSLLTGSSFCNAAPRTPAGHDSTGAFVAYVPVTASFTPFSRVGKAVKRAIPGTRANRQAVVWCLSVSVLHTVLLGPCRWPPSVETQAHFLRYMTAHVDVGRSVRSGAARFLTTQSDAYARPPGARPLSTVLVLAVEALVRWPWVRVAGLPTAAHSANEAPWKCM